MTDSHPKALCLFPGMLLVVVVTTLISYFSDAERIHGVPVLGSVDDGFFLPRLPQITSERIDKALWPALAIMFCGFVQASVIAKNYR